MTEKTNEQTLMEFPCDFPIKMMGEDTPEFHHTVRELVEKHTGPLSDEVINSAVSRNGRFVSITITVTAESRAQLDAIYREVTAHEAVLMAL